MHKKGDSKRIVREYTKHLKKYGKKETNKLETKNELIQKIVKGLEDPICIRNLEQYLKSLN
jgi:uncharacterized membrane-anchored protein